MPKRFDRTADRVSKRFNGALNANPVCPGTQSAISGHWARGSGAARVVLAGLAAQLLGGPDWSRWRLCLACRITGGWEPGLAGLRALKEKTLDADLLMVAAASTPGEHPPVARERDRR